MRELKLLGVVGPRADAPGVDRSVGLCRGVRAQLKRPTRPLLNSLGCLNLENVGFLNLVITLEC